MGPHNTRQSVNDREEFKEPYFSLIYWLWIDSGTRVIAAFNCIPVVDPTRPQWLTDNHRDVLDQFLLVTR